MLIAHPLELVHQLTNQLVFAHPLWLALVLVVPLPWLYLRSRGYLAHSSIGGLQFRRSSAHLVPITLLSLGFIALFIALAQPQHPYSLPDQSVKARDIIIAVDKSGSMSTEFDGTVPPSVAGNTELDKELPPLPPTPTLGEADQGDSTSGDNIGHRRIDAAQQSVLNFVRDRYVSNSGDRVGVEVFDSSPYWSWPLTGDLRTIYRKLQLTNRGVGGGTNFGEQKPGPIDAAAELFDELGQSNTRVLIMVTDGEDSLSDDAQARLLKVLQSRGIRLYVIGVGPTLAQQDVDIIKVAQAAGGRVFRVENAGDMNLCFQTINSLEQSPVKVMGKEKRAELFYYFATAAAVLLLLGLIGEALVLNE